MSRPVDSADLGPELTRGAHDAAGTIEWEISLYVRLGPGTDMSDYF